MSWMAGDPAPKRPEPSDKNYVHKLEQYADDVERMLIWLTKDYAQVGKRLAEQISARHESVDILSTEPYQLPGLNARTANLLYHLSTKKDQWARNCDGMSAPTTVALLLEWSRPQLLSFPRFGRGSLNNLEVSLAAFGLKVRKR